MPSAGYALNTIAELTAIPSVERTDNMAFIVKEKKDWFIFDAFTNDSPSLLEDSYAPDEGTGLWRRMGGTLGHQNANQVSITGGFLTGISPIGIAIGGTGANNAEEARNNLGISLVGYNYAVNGDFQSALAGTSFSAVGRLMEMWSAATFGTGGAATISRQSFAFGHPTILTEPIYFLRWQQTTGGTVTNPEVSHAVENCRTLAGQWITVSFWARVASGSLLVNFFIRQNFGTGGTPSANTDSETTTFSIETTWQKFIYSVQLPSVSGKTVGTDANSSSLRSKWLFPMSSTFILDIADLKFEAGKLATPLERIDDSFRIARYYQVIKGNARFTATAAGNFSSNSLPFVREMRVAPTATVSGGTDVNISAAAALSLTAFGGRFQITSAAAGDSYSFSKDVVLEARL
ncbi:MAG: hypothetical protein AB1861_08330 [Cyanobacteriota bacterium]